MKNLVFLAFGFVVFTQLPLQASVITLGTQAPPQTRIEITLPNSSSVWESPGKVKMEWYTKNIPAEKTIQFYLTKDDMVVQELGIFQNNSFVDDVSLDRGLAEGDNYRVIGIELFPDNKYSIAKFATPFFTIKKAPRKPKPIVEQPTETLPKLVEEKPVVRESFDGRNLNYVNEIQVTSELIKINLRDHGRVDGDIVSIYLNGEAVVSKYLLTYRNRTFEVKLDPNKANDLFLYAHNLGKSPPNTVAMEIKDGPISEKIILNSDLKSCEAVLIKVAN